MKPNFTPYSVFALFAVISFFLLWFLRFYADSSDTLAYIVISENYINSGLWNNINTHWSPLISLLLVPLLPLFDNHITAFHVLQFFIGLFCLQQALKWIKRVCTHTVTVIFCGCISCCLIAAFGQLQCTPDLLFLGLILSGLYRISFMQGSNLFTTGLIFGLLFLCKSAGLVVFGFILLVFLWRNRLSGYNLLSSIKFVSGFLTLALPWIILQSISIGRCTYSTAGDYNFNIMNPALSLHSISELNHPALTGNLIAPADSADLFYWTKPYSIVLPEWRPWQSAEHTKQYAPIVVRNIKSLASYYLGKDGGTVVLIFTLLILIKKGRIIYSHYSKLWWLAAGSAILMLVYTLLVVNHRYVWLVDFSLIMLFGVTFDWLLTDNKKMPAVVMAGLFAALCLAAPAIQIFENAHAGKNEIAVAEVLHRNNITHTRFASLYHYESFENYTRSALIAYYSNSLYYGMLSPEQFRRKSPESLYAHDVKYLITYNQSLIKASDTLYQKVLLVNGCNVYKIR